jgi:hypothetical protein
VAAVTDEWRALERGLTETDRRVLWLARVAVILAYAAASWWLGRSGGEMTDGELGLLTVGAGIALVFVVLAGWVAGGGWRD